MVTHHELQMFADTLFQLISLLFYAFFAGLAIFLIKHRRAIRAGAKKLMDDFKALPLKTRVKNVGYVVLVFGFLGTIFYSALAGPSEAQELEWLRRERIKVEVYCPDDQICEAITFNWCVSTESDAKDCLFQEVPSLSRRVWVHTWQHRPYIKEPKRPLKQFPVKSIRFSAQIFPLKDDLWCWKFDPMLRDESCGLPLVREENLGPLRTEVIFWYKGLRFNVFDMLVKGHPAFSVCQGEGDADLGVCISIDKL